MSVDASSEAGSTPATPPSEAPAATPRSMVLEAPDVELARREAARRLGVPAGEITLRILARHKRGFLGLGGQMLELEATWSPPPPVVHGRIELSSERGHVSLAVFPPEGAGRPADLALFESMIGEWPLDTRDETVVAAALHAADGSPRVFGTIVPSVAVAEDSPVAVKVAGDEFTAWLLPWAPVPVDQETLAAALQAAGVTAGIDEALCAQLAGQILRAPVVIARGRPPRDGADARAEFVLEYLKASHGPTVREDGRVDYRDIGGQPLVAAGDLLVRKVPLVPAEPGLTVRGKTLPVKAPKDFELRRLAGQNTVLDEAGMTLTAKIGGLATRVGDRVAVMPLYSVPGDIDFKTGNVDFEGNLVITGGIKPGFRVRATGDIQIGGTVEAAHIEAGGAVTILGGIVGQGEAVIRAGGAVTARFVEQAEIHAGGPVTVGSEIRQSTVISEASVTVAGAGRIVGGLVRGRDFVEAKVLGSPSGSQTTVQAGWGEELAVEVDEKPRIPRVVAKNEVNSGVTITVGGATQRITSSGPGGVWREHEGKIQYSAA